VSYSEIRRWLISARGGFVDHEAVPGNSLLGPTCTGVAMTSIWWFLAAFFGGAIAAILVFASVILLFAVTKVALSGSKRTLRLASGTGGDDIGAGSDYAHPSLHPIAVQ